MRARRFRLDSTGLARVLGDLEAEIMEALWRVGSGRIHDVCEELGPEVHHRTVATVMNRLVDKGLLVREQGTGRAFVYRPSQSREAFLADVSRQVLRGLVHDFGGSSLAPFLDAVEELSPDTLEGLQRLVAERLDRQDRGDA